jgi:F-type H+-transporting ATPase subunit beta
MTATVESTQSRDGRAAGVGRVARVIGPVVDVEFGVDDLPEIYNALTVDVDFGAGSGAEVEGENKHTLTLEVAQHIGDNLVRAISLQPTDGLVRGAPVHDTGSPLSVPFGDVT